MIARVQSEDGTPLEGTGTGELMVWTPFQTRGYLKSSLNARQFISVEGEEWPHFYRTGDIVRRHDDGTLTLEGRADFYPVWSRCTWSS